MKKLIQSVVVAGLCLFVLSAASYAQAPSRSLRTKVDEQGKVVVVKQQQPTREQKIQAVRARLRRQQVQMKQGQAQSQPTPLAPRSRAAAAQLRERQAVKPAALDPKKEHE